MPDWRSSHSYLNGWSDRLADRSNDPPEYEFDPAAYGRGYANAGRYLSIGKVIEANR